MLSPLLASLASSRLMPIFLSAVPPRPEVYSCSPFAPCLSEGSANKETLPLECPFRVECVATSRLHSIVRTYGRSIRTTLAEPSANLIVRSETFWAGRERYRVSLRRHIHERVSGGDPLGYFEQRDLLVFSERSKRRAIQACLNELGFSVDSAVFGAPGENGYQNTADEVTRCIEKLVDDSVRKLEQVHFGDQLFAAPFPVNDGFRLCWEIIGESVAGFKRDFQEKLPSKDLVIAIDKVLRQELNLLVNRPLVCHSFRETEVFGDYLGFVDVRMHATESEVAFGLLRPPRSIRTNTRAILIEGEYGEIFGGPSFLSSVFIMHDSKGGAACAQASGVMLLAMLADRGAMVPGAFDLTTRAIGCGPSGEFDLGAAVAPLQLTESLKHYGVSAMITSEQEMSVRRADEETAQKHTIKWEFADWFSRWALLLCVECYINARFPVIIWVNAKTWSSWSNQNDDGHAVVVVGAVCSAGRNGDKNRFSALIVHDPQSCPYLLVPVEDCFEAMGDYTNPAKERMGQLLATFAAPHVPGFVNGPELLQVLKRFSQYFREVADESARWEAEMRYLRGSEVATTFGTRTTDLMRLQLKDSQTGLPSQELREERASFDRITDHVANRGYGARMCWCIYARDSKQKLPSRLWVVPVDTDLNLDENRFEIDRLMTPILVPEGKKK